MSRRGANEIKFQIGFASSRARIARTMTHDTRCTCQLCCQITYIFVCWNHMANCVPVIFIHPFYLISVSHISSDSLYSLQCPVYCKCTLSIWIYVERVIFVSIVTFPFPQLVHPRCDRICLSFYWRNMPHNVQNFHSFRCSVFVSMEPEMTSFFGSRGKCPIALQLY